MYVCMYVCVCVCVCVCVPVCVPVCVALIAVFHLPLVVSSVATTICVLGIVVCVILARWLGRVMLASRVSCRTQSFGMSDISVSSSSVMGGVVTQSSSGFSPLRVALTLLAFYDVAQGQACSST